MHLLIVPEYIDTEASHLDPVLSFFDLGSLDCTEVIPMACAGNHFCTVEAGVCYIAGTLDRAAQYM